MAANLSSFSFSSDVQKIVEKFDENLLDIEKYTQLSGNEDKTISDLKAKIFERIKEFATYIDSFDKNIDAKREFHQKMNAINEKIKAIVTILFSDSKILNGEKTIINQMMATFMNMLNPDSIPDVVKKHLAYHGDILRTRLIELFKSPSFNSSDFSGTQKFVMQYCEDVLQNACYHMSLVNDYSPKLFLLRGSAGEESGELKVVTLSFLDLTAKSLRNIRLYYNSTTSIWQKNSNGEILYFEDLNELIKSIGQEKKIIFQICPKMQ